MRILPQDTASSGRAPASEPSNCSWVITFYNYVHHTSCAVLMYTAWLAPFLIKLALHMWCFTIPPPKMIAPVLFANTVMLLILRMSCTISITRPGFLNVCKYNMSPIEPSVKAGQNTGMSFYGFFFFFSAIYQLILLQYVLLCMPSSRQILRY